MPTKFRERAPHIPKTTNAKFHTVMTANQIDSVYLWRTSDMNSTRNAKIMQAPESLTILINSLSGIFFMDCFLNWLTFCSMDCELAADEFALPLALFCCDIVYFYRLDYIRVLI